MFNAPPQLHPTSPFLCAAATGADSPLRRPAATARRASCAWGSGGRASTACTGRRRAAKSSRRRSGWTSGSTATGSSTLRPRLFSNRSAASYRERELTTLLSEDEQIERLRNHTSLVVAPSHLPHQEPKFDGRNRPMSGGFAAVMLALSVCGEVDLYGFSGGGGNHYYPKLTAIKEGCTVRLSAPRHRSCCLS